MMIKTSSNANIIQAFPLTVDTAVQVAGNTFSPSKDNVDVIRVIEDNTEIKTDFIDGTSSTLTFSSNTDLAIGSDVISITINTGSILVG